MDKMYLFAFLFFFAEDFCNMFFSGDVVLEQRQNESYFLQWITCLYSIDVFVVNENDIIYDPFWPKISLICFLVMGQYL